MGFAFYILVSKSNALSLISFPTLSRSDYGGEEATRTMEGTEEGSAAAEVSVKGGHMKALSLLPYWAMDILEGYKTIECRTWKTDYRGTIVICSSSKKQHRCIASHALCLADIVDIVPFKRKHLKDAGMDEMPTNPCYAWILDNIRPIVPVPAKGKLHLWEYDGKIELLDEKKFKSKKAEEQFWDWYDSLYYLSPKELKYEKEHPELFQEDK